MTIHEISTASWRLQLHRGGGDLRFVHLTALPRRPVEREQQLPGLYHELAEHLTRRRLDVLSEKVFAEPGLGPAVRAARGEALSAREDHLPMTLVGGRPCAGGQLAGVQISGVEGPAVGPRSCRTLRLDGRAVGRLLQTPQIRMAFVADVLGLDAGGQLARGEAAQGQQMFRRAAELVSRLGFTFQHVARTWIYVERLLDWYAELNRIRTEVYSELGVYDPQHFAALPASTGIQAVHPDGAECFMDLLLVDGPGIRDAPPSEPMVSSHQCEAGAYGSSFSRGKKVRPAVDLELLYVSGTASIDLQGQTVHLGDPSGQILETLAAVHNLLSASGAGLDDIVSSALFFKNEPAYRAWQTLAGQGQIPSFPGIALYEDVCRDELLFELEPTAVLELDH